MTSRITAAVPVIPVAEMSESIAFYTEILGFELAFDWPAEDGSIMYAGVARDGVRLHLSTCESAELAKKVGGQTMLRFDVTDIEDFYEACKAHEGVIHPNSPLQEKPWGSLEFGVIDPCGVCISFQAVEEQ